MDELENEIKALIIESLDLEDTRIEDIKAQEPLFGDGLGLDSIDALELGVALKKKYNIRLDSNLSALSKHFYSVASLANFVVECKENVDEK